jgi:hypothetical protein
MLIASWDTVARPLYILFLWLALVRHQHGVLSCKCPLDGLIYTSPCCGRVQGKQRARAAPPQRVLKTPTPSRRPQWGCRGRNPGILRAPADAWKWGVGRILRVCAQQSGSLLAVLRFLPASGCIFFSLGRPLHFMCLFCYCTSITDCTSVLRFLRLGTLVPRFRIPPEVNLSIHSSFLITVSTLKAQGLEHLLVHNLELLGVPQCILHVLVSPPAQDSVTGHSAHAISIHTFAP